MTRAAAIFAVLVAMLAAGAVLAQSVTTVRVVRSQTVLQAEDLALAEASVPGGIAAIEAVVGQEAKVALYPGRPILDSQLGAPALVERNQVVRMSYASGPLRIVTDGRVARPRRRGRAGAGDEPRLAPDGQRHRRGRRQHRGRTMRLPLLLACTAALAACGAGTIGQPPEMTTDRPGRGRRAADPDRRARRARGAAAAAGALRLPAGLALEHLADRALGRPAGEEPRRHPDDHHRDRRRGRDAQLDHALARGQRERRGRRASSAPPTCCRRAR